MKFYDIVVEMDLWGGLRAKPIMLLYLFRCKVLKYYDDYFWRIICYLFIFETFEKWGIPLYWDILCMSILDHWRRGVYFLIIYYFCVIYRFNRMNRHNIPKGLMLSRFSGVKSLIRFEPFNHWYLYFFWGKVKSRKNLRNSEFGADFATGRC